MKFRLAQYAVLALTLFFALGICSRVKAEEPKYVVAAHGWDGGTSLGPLSLVPLANTLEAAGFVVIVPSLGNENVANAHIIEDIVEGLPEGADIYVVGHSMGGLSARYCIKFLPGCARVSVYVSLDTPQYGTKKAWFMNWQMLPGSAFLTSLNSGDPTPGGTTYVQLVVEYMQLVPGAWWKSLAAEGINHRNVVADPASMDLVVRILQGDYSELAVP